MPKEIFPAVIIKVSKFLPLTHVVELLQGTFRGASFKEYGGSLIVLLSLIIVCVAAGAVLYKKKSWL